MAFYLNKARATKGYSLTVLRLEFRSHDSTEMK